MYLPLYTIIPLCEECFINANLIPVLWQKLQFPSSAAAKAQFYYSVCLMGALLFY